MPLTDHYEHVREHIGRPPVPGERAEIAENGNTVPLAEFEALYVRRALKEDLGRRPPHETNWRIERGLIQYINRRVKEDRGSQNTVTLYLKTDRARKLVEEALVGRETPYEHLKETLIELVTDDSS